MQNRKEELTEFVETIKNKVRDWEFRHPWPARFFEYILLFLLVVFVVAVIFANFNLFHTDADSARYMLSALVQSQAAIVAIVITLTLIAVQLTASAYSPRVIRIFMKNPDMRILLLFYGVSIFYGLLVLKMIRMGDLRQITFLNTPLEYHIVSAYVAGAFTFFMLFPYMWNIISLLKSENIIKRLAIEITKDKILKSKENLYLFNWENSTICIVEDEKPSKIMIDEKEEKATLEISDGRAHDLKVRKENSKLNIYEDPIQPIMDIVHGSIMKYDFETTRVGLKAVTDRVIEIIDLDGEREVSKCFCDHFKRVGRLTVSKTDEESTIEVIENLGNFGKLTVEKGLEDAASLVAESLSDVGKVAAKKGLEDATWQVALSLRVVGKTAAKERLEDATSIAAESLRVVGETAAETGFEDVTWQVALSLRVVGEIAAETGLKEATSQVAEFLGDVGKIAAEKGLKEATSRVAWSLGSVGRTAVEKGKEFEDVTKQVAQSFMKTGVSAVENGLNGAAQEVATFLAELTILSEEIVKTTIQKYESTLTEQDSGSFQKFKKLYEQELEKVRAEKW